MATNAALPDVPVAENWIKLGDFDLFSDPKKG